MSPRVHIALDAEGHERFVQLIEPTGFKFLEEQREEFVGFGAGPVLVATGVLVTQNGSFPQCQLRSGAGKYEFLFDTRGSGNVVQALEDLARALGSHPLD